jgi:hypothetical protein
MPNGQSRSRERSRSRRPRREDLQDEVYRLTAEVTAQLRRQAVRDELGSYWDRAESVARRLSGASDPVLDEAVAADREFGPTTPVDPPTPDRGDLSEPPRRLPFSGDYYREPRVGDLHRFSFSDRRENSFRQARRDAEEAARDIGLGIRIQGFRLTEQQIRELEAQFSSELRGATGTRIR